MPIPCARCSMPLPDRALGAGSAVGCTLCGAENQVRVFPAALRAPAPVRVETALEGEAACFDHPGKRAVAACNHCGRFVCDLCSVAFGNETWCPSCVTAKSSGAGGVKLEISRTLYDSIALSAPLLSFLMWPVMVITAPGTVVFSILKWRQPLSLVRRNRWRFVMAILLGLVETGAWAVGIVYLLLRSRPGSR